MTDHGGRVVQQPNDHPYTVQLPQLAPHVDPWDVSALQAAGARVIHVHFGFEQQTVPGLARWLHEVHAVGLAVVHTVHDLANPHLEDQRCFDELVDLLLSHADALLTLSRHAAVEIFRRAGRRSTVVPHGAIVHPGLVTRRPVHRRSGVYVHAATCRPNLDVDLLRRLAGPARHHGGLHVHVRPPTSARAAAAVDQLRSTSGIALDISPRLDDTALWDRVASAAAVLLPYRWATHSGLLEAAHDLGTPVLAPDVGALVEQGAMRLDPEELADSLARTIASRPAVTAQIRRRQRRVSLGVHRALYRQLGAA